MFERRIIANSRSFHYGNGKKGITGMELICINTHSRDYFIIQPSNKQPARFLHVVVCLDFPLDVCVFWCGLVSTPFFCARKSAGCFCKLSAACGGGCALSGNLCVYRMQRTIFESSLHFKSVWKVQAAFFKRKYGRIVHKTAGKIVWNRHYISGKY